VRRASGGHRPMHRLWELDPKPIPHTILCRPSPVRLSPAEESMPRNVPPVQARAGYSLHFTGLGKPACSKSRRRSCSGHPICRQRHIHHLDPPATPGCGLPPPPPPGADRLPRQQPARRAGGAGARPSTITSEPLGMSGSWGRGSEGAIGERAAKGVDDEGWH
jgi:hypothetical protein